MILTIRSEWIKLRTVRVHFVLLVLAVAFPVTVTVLVAIFGDNPETVQNHELAELISGTSVIGVMLFGASRRSASRPSSRTARCDRRTRPPRTACG